MTIDAEEEGEHFLDHGFRETTDAISELQRLRCSHAGGAETGELAASALGGWTCPVCHSEFDRWGRNIGEATSPRTTFTLDNTSYATNPGRITLSDAKLRVLRPELYSLRDA